jgi:hypothetical protein
MMPASPTPTSMDLGGFNPGGGAGQALFSLNYYEGPPSVEARINDDAGAFYLYGEPGGFSYDQWFNVEIRKVGTMIGLYFDNVLMQQQAYSGTFLVQTLISFGINRSQNGNRRGYVDQPHLYYY